MVSGRMIAAILIAAAIAGTLFVPFSTAVTENSGDVTVTNESLTASPGDWQDLDGYDLNSGSETVYWENGSTYETLDASDYDVRDGPGELKINTSSSVSSGDSLKVSYTYAATDSTTETIVDLAPLFLALLILVALAGPMMKVMG